MKKIMFLIFVSFLAIKTNAQNEIKFDIDSANSTYIIQKVVEIENTTKDVLYKRIKYFIANSMNSAPDVIKLDDKENGTIIVKGLIPIYIKPATSMIKLKYGNVDFTLTVDLKDNKYRYTFTDFEHRCVSTGTTVGCCSYGNLYIYKYFKDSKMLCSKKNLTKVEDDLLKTLDVFISDLEKTMLQNEKEDKW